MHEHKNLIVFFIVCTTVMPADHNTGVIFLMQFFFLFLSPFLIGSHLQTIICLSYYDQINYVVCVVTFVIS